MKKIFLSIFFLNIFLHGCNDYDDGLTEYDKIANEIIHETGKKIKKSRGLELIGIGVGMNKLLGMHFCYSKPLTLEKARELIIFAANQFLEDINNCEKLSIPLMNDFFEKS